MYSRLVASNFTKNRKHIKEELCLNVIISFPLLSVVLLLRDVTKAVFLANQKEGTSGPYGGTPPVPLS